MPCTTWGEPTRAHDMKFPYKNMTYQEQIDNYAAWKNDISKRLSHIFAKPCGENSEANYLHDNGGYEANIARIQATIDFNQKMLKRDLDFYMSYPVEVVEETTHNYEWVIANHIELRNYWMQAFAIEYPSVVADIYRC